MMTQINLRIPDEDYELLEQIAEKQNIPITSLFRTIIHSTFDQWKIEQILILYQEGSIGFKKALKLGNLTPLAFLNKLQEAGIEPPHTEQMELRSAELADTLTKEQLYKDPNYQRKTPPLDK